MKNISERAIEILNKKKNKKGVDNCCLFILIFSFFSCQSSSVSTTKEPLFSFLNASETGIDFENTLTYTEDFNVYLYRSFYNGAGVGLADFDKDGNLDLFFCGNQQDNALYLGDGNFQFRDISQIAGIGSPNSWSTGVSIVDINQDGWLDIYVCKGGNPKDKNRRNELFIHQGLNKEGIPYFKEAAATYGINDLGFSIHACFLDYDRDGDLDMYLSNNSIKPTSVIFDVKQGLREQRDEGGGNKLYRNDNQFFTDVSKEAGIYSSAIGFGLGVAIADVNRDNWPDIYVANDFFEKDYLYINQQDGTFKESIDEATQELSLGSMGVDIADMNNDGYPEIFVTEMLPDTESRLKTKAVFDSWDVYTLRKNNGYHQQFPRNAFQLNRGKIDSNKVLFSEISRMARVGASDWSWGVQMMDFDNDGNNEIFITNGIVKDLLDQDYIDFYYDASKIRELLKRKGAVIKELIDHMPSEALPNYMFSQTEPLKYKNVAAIWGINQASFSSGASYGDIDNDGDLDLVVSNINQPPFIFKNNSNDLDRHFINLKIYNRDKTSISIGAQATLYAGGHLYFRELYPMRGTMSVVDDRIHIGIGEAEKIDSLLIVWPDGASYKVKNLEADQFLTIIQPPLDNTLPFLANKEEKPSPLLQKIRIPTINYQHQENKYVDFNREKLLYQMRSNEGPKLAIGDVNNDGLVDFFVGGAKGFAGSLFIQGKKRFTASATAVFEQNKESEDIGALFFDADNDRDLDLIVASGGYEFSSNSFALRDRLYFNDGKGNFQLSNQVLPNSKLASTSVIIPSDFDQDGDIDLFFGGRLIPSFYGLPASSFLLENDGKGKFKDVTKHKIPELINIGLVTDAVWLDKDQDGDEDLIIVGEWMPIRVFENQGEHFLETTQEQGLQFSNGFWNVVEKADLDGDGDEDLVVGNLGENSFLKASPEKPIQMYVNDFDRNGRPEQIITAYHGDKAYPLAIKKELTQQMPHLLKKYLRYTDYAEQTIHDIFSTEALEKAIIYEVFQTQSAIIWNEGTQFKLAPLTVNAQLAPVYSILIEDVNQDEQLDIILGGNQFKGKPQTGIYAASNSLLLRNLGQKKFDALSIAESGLNVEGQIRDVQKIKIGKDNYVIIARNNTALAFYRMQ